MTVGSSMEAMTRSVPPQCGQVSISMLNTRLSRCIQVSGARGLYGSRRGDGWWRRTISLRCLNFGAKTPWYRIRLTRGLGTSAASRAMNAAAIEGPLVRQGVSRLSHEAQKPIAIAGVCFVAGSRRGLCESLRRLSTRSGPWLAAELANAVHAGKRPAGDYT